MNQLTDGACPIIVQDTGWLPLFKPAGTTASTWLMPTSPGARPANVTVASLFPILTSGVADDAAAGAQQVEIRCIVDLTVWRNAGTDQSRKAVIVDCRERQKRVWSERNRTLVTERHPILHALMLADWA